MPGPNTTGTATPEDYVLGRGRLLVAEIDDTTGLPTADGFRDLGNVPEFSFQNTVEKLEHFSSRHGRKVVDKQIVLSQKVEGKFALEESNFENLELFFAGAEADPEPTNAAIAGWAEFEMAAVVKLGRWYRLQDSNGLRAYNIDSSKLTVESRNNAATVTAAGGRTLTWDDGPKTITASSGSFITDGYRAGHKILVAGSVSNNGTFTIVTVTAMVMTVVEALTDETIAATATINPADTALTEGTDFEVNEVLGLLFLSTTATHVSDGDDLDVTLTADAGAGVVNRMWGLVSTGKSYALMFIQENAANADDQIECSIHKVTLAPDGDYGLISDDIAKMGFSFVAESNELADADSPYFSISRPAGQ